ncbi:PilZ domain-containing protein [Maritalea sp. S77]|uniref:PilZ domain-containing protein n=1 Tax=Maritalea sp. S77 TaxID=3415125 RepID=UPI003C7B721C
MMHNPQGQDMQPKPVNEIVAKQSETLRRRIDKDQEKNAHKRKFQRHPTFAVSTLMLLDNSHIFDGVITEVSSGGVKFRPASSFLQERNGERVAVKIDEIQSTGVIRASRADGYGIQLLEKFSNEEMDHILQNYGVKD